MKLNMKLAGDSKNTSVELPEDVDVDDLRYKIEHQINFDLHLAGKTTTIIASQIQAFSIE